MKFFLMVLFLFIICNNCGSEESNSEETVFLFFSEKTIKASDAHVLLTGPKLSNEALFEIWLKSRASDLSSSKGGFTMFAQKRGLSIESIEAIAKPAEMKIVVSGKLNQRYSSHFHDVYLAYLNMRSLEELQHLTLRLEKMTDKERNLFFRTHPKRLSKLAFDWNSMCPKK